MKKQVYQKAIWVRSALPVVFAAMLLGGLNREVLAQSNLQKRSAAENTESADGGERFLGLFAQNVYIGDPASARGSIRVSHLKDFGVDGAFLGHTSVRATYTDDFVRQAEDLSGVDNDPNALRWTADLGMDFKIGQRVKAQLAEGIREIPVCVGSGRKNLTIAEEIKEVKRQILFDFDETKTADLSKAVFYIAYEPTVSLKDLKNQKLSDAETAMRFQPVFQAIYDSLVDKFGEKTVDAAWGWNMKVLIRWSVDKNNARHFMQLKTKSRIGKIIPAVHGAVFSTSGMSAEGFVDTLRIIHDEAKAMGFRGVGIENFKSTTEKDPKRMPIDTYVAAVYAELLAGRLKPEFIRPGVASIDAEFDRWNNAINKAEAEVVQELASDLTQKAPDTDGGDVLAFIGGTGGMGQSLAARAHKYGAEYVIGSRSARPAENIFTNDEAAAKGNYVFFTLKANESIGEEEREAAKADGTTEKIKVKVVTSPLRDQVIQQARNGNLNGKVVISIAAPFAKGEYLPPAKAWREEKGEIKVTERYASAAEATAAWIQEAGGKDVEVISLGIQIAPVEQMSNPDVPLKVQLAVAGDEKTCSVACTKILKFFNMEAEPVYIGGLDQCCYSEATTLKTIQGEKEVLVALRHRLFTQLEIIEFLKKEGSNVSKEKFNAFIRSRLDPFLLKEYKDPQVLILARQDLLDTDTAIEGREFIFVGLRRYADLMDKEWGKFNPGLYRDLLAFKTEWQDYKVNKELPRGFETMLDTLEAIATTQGALVFDADAVLENSGTVALLRAIKKRETKVRVVACSKDVKKVMALELIGVSGVAEVKQARVEDAVKELKRAGIPAERIVVVNSQSNKVDPGQLSGTTVLDLQKPNAKERKINAMQIVILKALERIYKDAEFSKAYMRFAEAYVKGRHLTAEELQKLNELLDIPLVAVSDEAARNQAKYENTIQTIDVRL